MTGGVHESFGRQTTLHVLCLGRVDSVSVALDLPEPDFALTPISADYVPGARCGADRFDASPPRRFPPSRRAYPDLPCRPFSATESRCASVRSTRDGTASHASRHTDPRRRNTCEIEFDQQNVRFPIQARSRSLREKAELDQRSTESEWLWRGTARRCVDSRGKSLRENGPRSRAHDGAKLPLADCAVLPQHGSRGMCSFHSLPPQTDVNVLLCSRPHLTLSRCKGRLSSCPRFLLLPEMLRLPPLFLLLDSLSVSEIPTFASRLNAMPCYPICSSHFTLRNSAATGVALLVRPSVLCLPRSARVRIFKKK